MIVKMGFKMPFVCFLAAPVSQSPAAAGLNAHSCNRAVEILLKKHHAKWHLPVKGIQVVEDQCNYSVDWWQEHYADARGQLIGIALFDDAKQFTHQGCRLSTCNN